MNTSYNELLKTDKVFHVVEKEWFHPILTSHGFTTESSGSTGLVRRATYTKGDIKITASVGAHGDYWSSSDGNRGYWSKLESYLKSLK